MIEGEIRHISVIRCGNMPMTSVIMMAVSQPLYLFVCEACDL